MKKLITVLAIIASLGLAAQGTLKVDGNILKTIPQYDVSNGSTEWIMTLSEPENSFKWNMFFVTENLTGTLDGTLTVFYSSDEGENWLAYPNMNAATISNDGIYGFDDIYTIYDKIKVIFTVNNITGGTVNINQRLITNPKR